MCKEYTLESCAADSKYYDADPDPTFTLMLIWIRLFTSKLNWIWILLLIKVMCVPDPPGLHLQPPIVRVHGPLHTVYPFVLSLYSCSIPSLMRIRIQLFTLIGFWIWIRLPKYYRSMQIRVLRHLLSSSRICRHEWRHCFLPFYIVSSLYCTCEIFECGLWRVLITF